MHGNPHDVAGVADHGLLHLCHAQLGIAIPVTFIQHHLLGVMRPSLGVAGATK